MVMSDDAQDAYVVSFTFVSVYTSVAAQRCEVRAMQTNRHCADLHPQRFKDPHSTDYAASLCWFHERSYGLTEDPI